MPSGGESYHKLRHAEGMTVPSDERLWPLECGELQSSLSSIILAILNIRAYQSTKDVYSFFTLNTKT